MGIGAAITGLASVLGVGATAGGFALAALRVGIAVGISVLAAKKPPKPGVQGRTLTSRGTLDAQQLVYGEALVAGSLAYRNTHGAYNSELWAVHCLAGHECDSITDVWLDNKIITNSQINGGSAAGGAVTTGTYAPARSGGANTVEIYKHLGTDTQTVDTALDTASSDWTSSHRLRGITYAVTMFKLNDRTADIWEAGDPANVKFIVQGKSVYDPRLDTSPGANPDNASYFAWTDNPALCLADYLRDDKFSPFPGGIAASRIDWDEVEAAADDCDTLVNIPTATTEKRFTFNGVLYGTAAPEENVQAILSSMNGSLIFTGGQYVIRAGVYDSPSDTLSEDDMIGPVSVTSALSSDKRVNTIKAIYIDKDKLYEPTETAPISISAYKTTRDGGDELVESIELPGVDGWYHAQRICQKRLHEANEELTIVVPCNLRAARLVPGERVNVEITERGWSPKVFKVLDWELFDRGGDQIGVNVTLREDDSSAYADPAELDYNTLSSGGTLTIADPTPIPSVDTIPRGIRYGEGTWSIELTANQDTAGADDGEILFSRGRFVLPDGTIRSLVAAIAVNTPWEGSTTPPDGRFYLIWGETSPDTRFGAATYSSDDAAGLFGAIYDRFSDQWYAVDEAGTETAFTPADADYVVATGTKTSASGGIDSLTALVSFQELVLPVNQIPEEFADFEKLELRSLINRTPSTNAWTINTTESLSWVGSKNLRFSDGSSTSNRFSLTYGTTRNIKILPNRRYIAVVKMYPFSPTAVNANASYSMDMTLTSGSVNSTNTIDGDDLTEDEWHELRFELDATANASQSAYLEFVATYSGAVPATWTFHLDAFMLIDVTELPEIQSGVEAL